MKLRLLIFLIGMLLVTNKVFAQDKIDADYLDHLTAAVNTVTGSNSSDENMEGLYELKEHPGDKFIIPCSAESTNEYGYAIGCVDTESLRPSPLKPLNQQAAWLAHFNSFLTLLKAFWITSEFDNDVTLDTEVYTSMMGSTTVQSNVLAGAIRRKLKTYIDQIEAISIQGFDFGNDRPNRSDNMKNSLNSAQKVMADRLVAYAKTIDRLFPDAHPTYLAINASLRNMYQGAQQGGYAAQQAINVAFGGFRENGSKKANFDTTDKQQQ